MIWHHNFTEKFSPLPGFEPGTLPVPSRYATNRAILAWIIKANITPFSTLEKFKFATLDMLGLGLRPDIFSSKLSKTQFK